jgi:hypothetical protein
MGLADNPKRFIGDKDLLIIDEIPTNLLIKSLAYANFARTREKASELGLKAQETFIVADDWVRIPNLCPNLCPIYSDESSPRYGQFIVSH